MRKQFFRRLVPITSLIFTMVLTSGTALAQTSVAIDSVKVIDLGGNKYKMVAKGTITIQNNHIPKGFSIHFQDPDGELLVAALNPPFDSPEPGKTTGIVFSSKPVTKGNGYIAFLALEYLDEKQQKVTVKSISSFNVP